MKSSVRVVRICVLDGPPTRASHAGRDRMPAFDGSNAGEFGELVRNPLEVHGTVEADLDVVVSTVDELCGQGIPRLGHTHRCDESRARCAE